MLAWGCSRDPQAPRGRPAREPPHSKARVSPSPRKPSPGRLCLQHQAQTPAAAWPRLPAHRPHPQQGPKKPPAPHWGDTHVRDTRVTSCGTQARGGSASAPGGRGVPTGQQGQQGCWARVGTGGGAGRRPPVWAGWGPRKAHGAQACTEGMGTSRPEARARVGALTRPAGRWGGGAGSGGIRVSGPTRVGGQRQCQRGGAGGP